MIRYATNDDLQEIKNIWDICFDFDNNGYNDHFFKKLFKPEDTIVVCNDKDIMSVGCRSKHVYMINGKALKGSFIYGIATDKQYRNNGFMNKILTNMIDQAQYQELITFIQGYDPKIYEKYGFEPIYYKTKYTLEKSKNTIYNIDSCTDHVSNNDLLSLYINIMKRFNGYMIRDLNYYELYKQELKSQNGNIIATYDKDKITGYMSVIKKGQEITIEECLYLDAKSLLILLSFAFRLAPKVYLNLTIYENVESLFNFSNKQVYPDTLMRINDLSLFNKLYEIEAKDLKDAMNLFKKPLFIRETI